MLSPDTAREAVVKSSRPLASEKVRLAKALGRRLSRPVKADRPLPPADRSAMDGFAVRSEDLQRVPAILRLKGEVAAGSSSRPRVSPGRCVRIYTGGNVPPGADAVVMIEQTRAVDEEQIEFRQRPEPGQHILKKGEDAARGDSLLTMGTRLGPAQIALLAAVGSDPVTVRRLARVGVLSTGRELQPAQAKVQPHEIRNSNGPALVALLQHLGGVEARDLGVAPDELDVLRRKIRRALPQLDMLILSGGASVGRYDLVPDALRAEGCKLIFQRVAQKPGKPTLFARHGRSLVFGLPGNPLSAWSTFHNLVRPALDVMSGGDGSDPPLWTVRLRTAVTVKGDRVRYLPARLTRSTVDAVWEAELVKNLSSADVVSAALSDGAVVAAPGAQTLEAGSLVSFVSWGLSW